MSVQNTFAVGDIVKLKSGGPKMTVHTLFNNLVRCKWFAGAKAETADFAPATLVADVEETKK